MCELYWASGWLWFPWHRLSYCYFCEDTSESFNSTPVLAIYQMPEKKREVFLNLRRLIVHSESACSFWSQPFDYLHWDFIHQLLWHWNCLSVQNPLAMVTASDEKSSCQQEYCLRWCCNHKTSGLLDGVAQFCHLPCSFASEYSVCVWRDLLVYCKELEKLFALLILWCKWVPLLETFALC